MQLKLEEVALTDDCECSPILSVAYSRYNKAPALNPGRTLRRAVDFIKRKLYPNVDFYSGIVSCAPGHATELRSVCVDSLELLQSKDLQ